MKQFKTIGVLGGMGPAASAYFYQLLITKSQQTFSAAQDDEYPAIIVNSLALKGSTEFGMEGNKLILNQLLAGITSLEKAGADFVVITCNSVHNLYDQLVRKSKLPILNLVKEVGNKVKNDNSKNVLVLSSETTDKYGLYDYLSEEGIKIIKPNTIFQKHVTKLILAVMGGTNLNEPKKQVIKQIKLLQTKGKIDSVVLGCTELPIAIKTNDLKIKSYDSLEILAEYALEFSHI